MSKQRAQRQFEGKRVKKHGREENIVEKMSDERYNSQIKQIQQQIIANDYEGIIIHIHMCQKSIILLFNNSLILIVQECIIQNCFKINSNCTTHQGKLLNKYYLQSMTLTKQRAQQRFKSIKQHSISYHFHINLQQGTHYQGLAEILFSLNQIPEKLHLDFKSTQIHSILLNEQQLDVNDTISEQGFISLDCSKLQLQNNKVCVSYRNKYDNDGSGCASFIDVDNKQYLYTQFESYFANRVLPLFDQPDLKAKMKLNVICPLNWKKVLSNEHHTVEKAFDKLLYLSHTETHHNKALEEFLSGIEGDNKMTIFPWTKLLPTYLYCFIAGDYQELKCENLYQGIPMSLYCIESLFKYMKDMADFVFEITIESMKFFQQFFGYKYPFNKYDQVFAHEYKWGAMQNAAIVTHNDRYIWKDAVSIESKLDFANTISHELAHHWFGNLVTMKWWDDLWLNESFADYISYLCLEKIKNKCKTINYESAMASFLTRKGWGYHEDQMITTHPIRSSVPNTNVADSIFDGITYSKGASTMKQLNFLMSEDKFSQALTEYFHLFEWKNATLDDFINVMDKHFTSKDFTLAKWRQLWLENACCNKICSHWNPHDNNKQSKMEIKQTYVLPQHPTLRMHRIKIGLVKEDGSIDSIERLINAEESTVIEYDGSRSYKAVILNYEDHSFVKCVIDKVSLDFFSQNLSKINDLLSRTLIWKSFYDMVKDGELRSDQYLNLVVKFIIQEPSDSIFQTQFDYLFAAINTYTPIKLRDELNEKVFDFVFNILTTQGQKLQQNRQVILKQKLVSFARTQKTVLVLLSWFKGQNQQLNKYQLTLSSKWIVVVKSFRLKELSAEEKWALFDKQEKIDPTDTAKNYKELCRALICNKQEFEQIYNKLKEKESNLSITVKQYMASGWNDQIHAQWLLEYRDRYFSDILKVGQDLQGEHFTLFYKNLASLDDDLELQIKKYGEIKLQGEKFDKHRVDLLKIQDQLKRRLKAYQLHQK